MKNLETIASIGVGIIAVHELSRLAFSPETKAVIKQRARDSHNGKLLSELSHTNGVPMECSHIDHSKESPNYDDPNNGMFITIYEHLNEHINNEGKNGLTINQNHSAIGSLKHKIKIWEQVQNYDLYYKLTHYEKKKSKV